MRNDSPRVLLLSCLVLLAYAPNISQAQRRVNVTQTFVPAFGIEPLVQKIEGRKGDVMQFQFQVTAKNKDADVEVKLVGLRQEMSGKIMHDETVVDSNVIQLINPGRYTIPRDEPHLIEGVLKVPSGNATHYSYGVLVRDFGTIRDRAPKFDQNGNALTQAGITFITQYVLRVDLTVLGARGENPRQVSIDQAALSVSNGLPQLNALLRNPSNTTFEFELRSQLKRSPNDRSFKALRMVMPVRQTMETEERYVARILPGSVLKLQEVLRQPLMSGKYQMNVEMLVGGRAVNKKTFTIEADSTDFPAQEVMVSQVGGEVYVSPSHIELSQMRGGSRRTSIEVKNNSTESRTIRLSAENSRGTSFPGLSYQPKEFTLSPGRTRKLSISLRRTREYTEPIEFGKLLVQSQSAKQEFSESGELPVAITFDNAPPAEITVEPLRWVATGKQPSFRAVVSNTGGQHMPLDARLLILSEAGERIVLTAGYGRWLMPDAKHDLEFRMPGNLRPGNYQLTCELQNGDSPIIKQQTFTVSDYDTASSASIGKTLENDRVEDPGPQQAQAAEEALASQVDTTAARSDVAEPDAPLSSLAQPAEVPAE